MTEASSFCVTAAAVLAAARAPSPATAPRSEQAGLLALTPTATRSRPFRAGAGRTRKRSTRSPIAAKWTPRTGEPSTASRPPPPTGAWSTLPRPSPSKSSRPSWWSRLKGLLKRGRLAELVAERRGRPGIPKLERLLALEPAVTRSSSASSFSCGSGRKRASPGRLQPPSLVPIERSRWRSTSPGRRSASRSSSRQPALSRRLGIGRARSRAGSAPRSGGLWGLPPLRAAAGNSRLRPAGSAGSLLRADTRSAGRSAREPRKPQARARLNRRRRGAGAADR